MLKKLLLTLLLGITFGVTGVANAENNLYCPSKTVGAADGECYYMTEAQTISNTYAKAGDEKKRYTINLLSLTLHNPEMIKNYVCNYEGFTDDVYLPIIAASTGANMNPRDMFDLEDYVYDIANHSFDFIFTIAGNKLVVKRGTADKFNGYVYEGTYTKSKFKKDVPTRLTTLMLVKALDHKLSRENSKDAMKLDDFKNSFKVDWDFKKKATEVTVFKTGAYYCSYTVPFTCENIVLHKNGEIKWKYMVK